jgi:Holliday junction resolvase RusA-like endonuclease
VTALETVPRPLGGVLRCGTDPLGRWVYAFVLPGPPRTKKTSNQARRSGKHCPACRLGTGHIIVRPSERFLQWQALVKNFVSKAPELNLALTGQLELSALVYRDKNIGDLGGYLNAICDVLQECGIVLNDRQIASFDGSRLHKDADNPRVEVALTVLSQAVVQEDIEL